MIDLSIVLAIGGAILAILSSGHGVPISLEETGNFTPVAQNDSQFQVLDVNSSTTKILEITTPAPVTNATIKSILVPTISLGPAGESQSKLKVVNSSVQAEVFSTVSSIITSTVEVTTVIPIVTTATNAVLPTSTAVFEEAWKKIVKNDTIPVPFNSSSVKTIANVTTVVPHVIPAVSDFLGIPVFVNGVLVTNINQLPPIAAIVQPHHKLRKLTARSANFTKRAHPKRSSNFTRIARQVVDTVHVSDEIIGPNGVHVPVASSTHTQTAPVSIPQVVDTMEVHDIVVRPNGVAVPVGTSVGSSVMVNPATQFREPVQPAVADTVQVQDAIVHPSGATIPLATATNSQFSSPSIVPAFGSNMVSSTGVNPLVAPAVAPTVSDVTTVADSIVQSSGAIIPAGGVTLVNPINVPAQVDDVTTVEDSVVPPSGVVSIGNPIVPGQVEDTDSVQDLILSPTGVAISLSSDMQFRSMVNGFFKRSFNASHIANRQATLNDLKILAKISNASSRPFPKTITFTNPTFLKSAPVKTGNIITTTPAPVLLNSTLPSQVQFFSTGTTSPTPKSVTVFPNSTFANASLSDNKTMAMLNSRELLEMFALVRNHTFLPNGSLEVANFPTTSVQTSNLTENFTQIIQPKHVFPSTNSSAMLSELVTSAIGFRDEQPLPTKEDLEIAAAKSFLWPKSIFLKNMTDPRDNFGVFTGRDIFY